jgi:hypothetical protein
LANEADAVLDGERRVSGRICHDGVFGLAYDGTTMYAVNGTDVYSVNLSTAAVTLLFNYSGEGLGDANGTAFVNENVSTTPIPAALPLFTSGLGLMGFINHRRRRRMTHAAPAAA